MSINFLKSGKFVIVILFVIIGIFSFCLTEGDIGERPVADFSFEVPANIQIPAEPDEAALPVGRAVSRDASSTDSSRDEAEAEADTETTATRTPAIKKSIIVQNVPFSPQAPFAEWDDLRQEDGCEEMTAIMAMRWVKGKGLAREEARNELFAISAFEEKTYGYFQDTAAADTADRIFNEYFKYDRVSVRYDIKAEDIIRELEQGNIVIVPVDGQAVGNPNYKNGGPERHDILIKGYDYEAEEFITNDPGTRKGENYRYGAEQMIKALRDYPSGEKAPITEKRNAMIVVSPK